MSSGGGARPFLASLIALAGLAPSAPAQAAGWSFPIGAASLAPTVSFEGAPAQLAQPVLRGDTVAWSVTAGGREVARLVAQASSDSRLDLTLTAEAVGRFQYELWTSAADARPLDVTSSRPAPGTTTRFHYPYDWETAHVVGARRQRDGQDIEHVAPIELVTPGFAAGGAFFALDTWKLTRVDIEAGGVATKVGIPKTIEVNGGFDTVTPDLPLASGATSTLTLLAAPTYDKLSALRFGTPRPVGGRMTFLYNKGWPCPEPACNIAIADYDSFAARLKGAFDLAIVRSYDPSAAIASAFRRNGIDAYYYLYLGAERRTTGGRFLHEDWIAHDASGQQYGAPIVAKDSSWGLYDIRRPEIRAALVARAVGVLGMGYRGVFFDGPAFWLASDGRVGGSAPGATISWAFARTLLLQEIRAAMAKVDPASRVGILGDRFYDGQGLADFCLKESYAENWLSIDPNPDMRILKNAAGINRRWDDSYRRYTTNSLFIGQKGSNPLLIGTGLAWGKAPADTWFTEIGDVYPIDGSYATNLARMGTVLAANSLYRRPPRGSAIAALDPPDAALFTFGPSMIGVRDPVTLTLDAPTPVLSLTAKTVSVSATVHLDDSSPAIVAERHDAGWAWSGYGFAYRDAQTYLYGDVMLGAAPAGSTRDRIVLSLSTQPGALSPKKRDDAPTPFAARTVVFHMPTPRAVAVTAVPGAARVDAPMHPEAGGGFSIALPASPAFGDFTVALDYGADAARASPATP